MQNPSGAFRTRTDRRLTTAVATLSIIALIVASIIAGAIRADAAELPRTFISASTQWKYSDDNTDPAAGSDDRLVWTAPGFDDAGWRTASGGFGAKNGAASGLGERFPINTLLNHFIDGTKTPTVATYHFRSQFSLSAEQLGQIHALRGTIVYDDAVQIFVNGTKVAGFVDDRVEAAPEAERNLMYAGDSNGSPLESTFTVPAAALTAGENTIAVALYQDRATSSDIYLDVRSLEPVELGAASLISDLVMTVGQTQNERNLAWYSETDVAQVVQYAPASAASGSEFPASAARSVSASGGRTTSGEFNRFASLTTLKDNTTYVYRVGNDDGWSPTQRFRTASSSPDYNFLFFGDPQIGASGNVQSDQAGWTDTLNVAMDAFPAAELLFSAGDQVEHAGSEAQYEALLAPDQLRQIPFVPVNGNHDVGSKAYEQHFNVPNLDTSAGPALSPTSSGGNYWFTHKDVLFMVINSNNNDAAAHEKFLRDVVAEHGDKATWKVLAFHHSIYSVASHVNDASIIKMRTTLPELISEVGIDLVLQGHDHSYTRSYLIKDGELANPEETQAQRTVTADPGEVLYVTANSASGSKYYNVKAPDAWYASVINQERVRNYSNIQVTNDAITVTTLRSEQNGSDKPVNSIVDEVTLTRAGQEPPVEPSEPTDPTEPSEPTDPTEPSEPAEPTEPTDPEDDEDGEDAPGSGDRAPAEDEQISGEGGPGPVAELEADTSGTLPVTGAEVTAFIAGSALLLLAGAWLAVTSRRRRAQRV